MLPTQSSRAGTLPRYPVQQEAVQSVPGRRPVWFHGLVFLFQVLIVVDTIQVSSNASLSRPEGRTGLISSWPQKRCHAS